MELDYGKVQNPVRNRLISQLCQAADNLIWLGENLDPSSEEEMQFLAELLERVQNLSMEMDCLALDIQSSNPSTPENGDTAVGGENY